MPRKEDVKIATENTVGIVPVGPRFIALPSEYLAETEGGILLPQQAQDNQQRTQPEAIVVRISEDLKANEKVSLEVGSRVLLNPTAPSHKFEYAGKEYLMIDWSVVKGIYEE